MFTSANFVVKRPSMHPLCKCMQKDTLRGLNIVVNHVINGSKQKTVSMLINQYTIARPMTMMMICNIINIVLIHHSAIITLFLVTWKCVLFDHEKMEKIYKCERLSTIMSLFFQRSVV